MSEPGPARERARRAKFIGTCSREGCDFTARSRSRSLAAAQANDHEAVTGHATEVEPVDDDAAPEETHS